MIDRLTGSFWVRGVLTAAVLALLLSRLDVARATAAMLRLDAAAAVFVLVLLAIDRAVMVWRWVILLRATGAPVAVKSAVWIYLVSSFIGSFLPAGIGGDAARAYALGRRTMQGPAAVASVAVDRVMGLLSIVAVAVLGLLVAGGDRAQGLQRPMLAVCGAGLIVLTALLWADRWAGSWMPVGVLSRLAEAVGRYRGHRTALVVVLLLSLGVQILRILQAWLLGRGIGIDVPFSYYLLFMPAGLVALMLPVSLNGFGLPQGLIVWLLQPVNVPAPDAFALSTLIVLSGIVANLPGAWLYVRARRTSDTTGTAAPRTP